MKKVEIQIAYRWICDECGIDNYGPVFEVPQEESEEIRECGDFEEGGAFYHLPYEVECGSCGAEYEVEARDGNG